MDLPQTIAKELNALQQLCQSVLQELEEQSGLEADAGQRLAQRLEPRKKILAELTQSLDKVREHRVAWLKVEPTIRQEHPEIAELLRETQNLIMRILVLDRENEKAWLRKGLVPARLIPPAAKQQPHFVTNLYRRNSYA